MLIVQKYGGATLADPEKIKSAAQRIAVLKSKNIQVVAVVSAMGQTTNQLIDLAQKVSDRPLLREMDMLLTVGERISMSLVSMALNDLGCDAISFTGSQAGILTDDTHLNAIIQDIKGQRVIDALNKNQVVILAGFQGVSPASKEITTLGRGGSDTSAVAMAAFLNADRCEILKDVASIFTADPKVVSSARPLNKLNYSHLLEMTYWGAKVLHYRSVELAAHRNVTIYVGPASNHEADGTLITGGFMFESSKPIAVNSHSQVLEIVVHQESQSVSLKKLITELSEKQIGVPQVLHGFEKNGQNHFLITGPSEMLAAVQKNFSQHSMIKILPNDYCSVSLTCSGSTLNDALLESVELLEKNNISPIYFIQSAMSLNFIVQRQQRDIAIKNLHSLIK